jgi:hypothetical protein
MSPMRLGKPRYCPWTQSLVWTPIRMAARMRRSKPEVSKPVIYAISPGFGSAAKAKDSINLLQRSGSANQCWARVRINVTSRVLGINPGSS